MSVSPRLFELSGENEELAAAEVEAVARAEELPFRELERSDCLLVADTGGPGEFARLALTHSVMRFLGVLEDPGGFEGGGLELGGDSFSLRARRVRGADIGFSTDEVERVLGSRLVEAGGEVDLEEPDRVFRVLMTAEGLFLGEVELEVDRSFAQMRPHQRSYFHPGAVEPVTARVAVNLSRVPSNGLFFNPMCGNGSMLVQAEKVGIRGMGLDVDPEMVRGSVANLREEGLPRRVVLGDARSTPFRRRCFDGAAADLPYGKSVQPVGESLAGEAVRELRRVVERGGRFVLTAPEPLEGAEEVWRQRVHRSLTRYMCVFEAR